jgi:hypothetical protein
MAAEAIPGFKPARRVSNGKLSIPVYVSETGEKPLIVTHELSGMSESFIGYCRRMADEGFKVHTPLMFKSPNTNMNGLQSLRFCLSAEFRGLFGAGGDGGRPFTAWLLHLVRIVSQEHSERKVGVVGMCLTGGFALAGIAQPNVEAAAACQPAFPFFFGIETLGLSERERDAVRRRAASLPQPCAKTYRFAGDRICRASHMRAVRTLLGAAVERYPDPPGSGHSTLTGETANEEVFQDVLRFLNARL